MITTHLNLFDVSVIAIMLLSCLFAFFRGFVREILSLGAWVGAGIVTIYCFPFMAERLQPHFKNAMVAGAFGTLGIYIIALVIFSMINMFILKFVKDGSDVGMLDNAMGFIFGAFRGALIVSLGFFLVSIAMPEKEYPDWIKESLTRPYVEKGAVILARIAPQYLREISSLEKRAVAEANNRGQIQQDDIDQGSPYATPSSKGTRTNTGYSPQATSQLDRLIDESSGKNNGQ